jgi:glycosyltransferase involved in cell wall biosynthesis
MSAGRLRVNLVGNVHHRTGIGRYRGSLMARLADRVEYVHCEVYAGALAGVPGLRAVPLAVRGLDPGAPVHITQLFGSALLRFRRLPPTVVTVHDLGPLVWPREYRMLSLVGRVLMSVDVAGLRRAERLLADSRATARSLVELVGVDPAVITVAYPGIDRAVFWPRPEARQQVESRLGIGEWDRWRTLLAVGTELPRKNLPALLGAVRLYQQRGERVRLVKAGSPGGAQWRDRTVRDAVDLGVRERVHFVDDATDDDLACLYSAADAYVCMSHVEGFGLPTVEAMACGAPTVVAPSGSLPEVVGEAGVVLAHNRSDALVEALDRLLDDAPTLARLGELATRQAAQFDWGRTADDTLCVYRQLVSAPADGKR